eukprot:scaffold195211_cov25-Tisochrysis_lutea.AAC.2
MSPHPAAGPEGRQLCPVLSSTSLCSGCLVGLRSCSSMPCPHSASRCSVYSQPGGKGGGVRISCIVCNPHQGVCLQDSDEG